jgi:hypothetical protein
VLKALMVKPKRGLLFVAMGLAGAGANPLGAIGGGLEVVLQTGHTHAINSVALSADGKYFGHRVC